MAAGLFIGVVLIFFIDIVGLLMLSNDTNLIMASITNSEMVALIYCLFITVKQ